MDDELAFIRAIQANPTDMTTKLVFADWLEERGHGEKAEWLRLFVDSAKFKPQSPQLQRLNELQYGRLPTVWVNMITRARSIPEWDYFTTISLAHLEATLNVYASLNGHSSDISFTFQTALYPKDTSIEVIAKRMNKDPKVVSVTLTPMANWEMDTLAILQRWLFHDVQHAFQTTDSFRLAVATSEGRYWHSHSLMKLIRGVITPIAGWQYVVSATGYYALDWTEILLEGADRVLYLGFMFDD